ncbi:hypothetical protein H500_00810 [Helicobacter pylori CG-IMSS-2012]|nr:hypothetical protein H500_00810 [Helicobacter pylori CG-IMSS-2012]
MKGKKAQNIFNNETNRKICCYKLVKSYKDL